MSNYDACDRGELYSMYYQSGQINISALFWRHYGLAILWPKLFRFWYKIAAWSFDNSVFDNPLPGKGKLNGANKLTDFC